MGGLLLGVFSACTDFNRCEWEDVPLTEDTWNGQTPEQWTAPFVGSWQVQPTWLDEQRRPPVGVAELFQVDLARRDEAMVRQIVEPGYCDPSPSLIVPLQGSIQSLDGAIRAVHTGSEVYWMVAVTDGGVDGLSLRSETKDGSLRWSEEHFDGDPEEGHYWRFFLDADADGGSVVLDHYVRNDEMNKVSTAWGVGKWYW